MLKRVSVICPTYNRASFLPQVYACFAAQTYANKELIILDDSEHASEKMGQLARDDARFRYIHLTERQSIGQKRNTMIAMATGDIIVHFDDDDFYATGYISFMCAHLSDASLVKLDGWFNYSERLQTFTYWDTTANNGLDGNNILVSPTRDVERTLWNKDGQHRWVYGFSYVYLKSLALEFPFLSISSGEDNDFVERVRKVHRPCRTVADTTGLMLHMIHKTNASHVWPQYVMPLFLLHQFFPGVITTPTHADVNK